MDPMRFARPGHTAAVVLGAHTWPHFSNLNGGEAFCNSASAIRNYLTDPGGIGLSNDDILDLFDSEESADEQLLRIGEFLSAWIKRAGGRTDALTDLYLYYVGHGDFIGNTTEFLMLVRASRPRREMTAIPARALASVLRDEAPFVRQVVVLDCCWSGAAQRTWQSGAAPDVAAKTAAELMPNNGTVLLCSSSEDMPSMAPQGAEYTMFTGALIEALRAGDPLIRGPLSPRRVRDLAFEAMRRRWGPDAVRPVVHAVERGSGDLSDTPLFPNNAEAGDAESATDPPQPPTAEATIWGRRQFITIGIAAAAATAVTSGALIVTLPRVFGDKPPVHDPNLTTMEDRGPALTSESYIRNAVAWFKERFGAPISKRLEGTPLTPSFIVALAVSESYYLWGKPLPPMATGDLLELCVADTIDAPHRKAFPTSKAALVAAPHGSEMFDIARAALVKAGAYHQEFSNIATKYPDRFVHAFGIFAYDLQFFLTEPDFFLQKQWRNFDKCLERVLPQLLLAVKRAYGGNKTKLSEDELVYVGIAWNRGSVDFRKGYKQGFMDSSGHFYGENLATYLRIAATVPDNLAAIVPVGDRAAARFTTGEERSKLLVRATIG
jgi:Caspase domain